MSIFIFARSSYICYRRTFPLFKDSSVWITFDTVHDYRKVIFFQKFIRMPSAGKNAVVLYSPTKSPSGAF
jgi:hypothetical protein